MLVFAGEDVEELVWGQGAQFDGAAAAYRADSYLLVCRLFRLVGQFFGPAPLADAVGEVEHRRCGDGIAPTRPR